MAEPDEIAERLADLTGRLESLLADLGRPVDEEGSTAELRLSSDTPVVEVLLSTASEHLRRVSAVGARAHVDDLTTYRVLVEADLASTFALLATAARLAKAPPTPPTIGRCDVVANGATCFGDLQLFGDGTDLTVKCARCGTCWTR